MECSRHMQQRFSISGTNRIKLQVHEILRRDSLPYVRYRHVHRCNSTQWMTCSGCTTLTDGTFIHSQPLRFVSQMLVFVTFVSSMFYTAGYNARRQRVLSGTL